MKQIKLLPYRFKQIGYMLLVPFLALGIAYMFLEFTIPWLEVRNMTPRLFVDSMEFSATNNLTDELAAVGVIMSLSFIAFSRERVEDEAIQFFRLEALQWAVYANYIVLVACILLVYGIHFFSVITYNMFTVLIIFILRFRYVLFRYNQAAV
jgi:hypothetical protein